jgi:hypothetical protein
VAFNSTFTCRYIDDVLSINNDQFNLYVDSIYYSELEIKNTTESSISASDLDVFLNINAGGKKANNSIVWQTRGFQFCHCQLPIYEMTKITNSNQFHKSYRKYKSENGRILTSEYTRDGIRYHGGVRIPCWPVTPAVGPISKIKRYEL